MPTYSGPNYPTSLDTSTVLVPYNDPPTSADVLNESGNGAHHAKHNLLMAIVEALEVKLGIGSSTPAADTMLVDNGAGASQWLSRAASGYGLTGNHPAEAVSLTTSIANTGSDSALATSLTAILSLSLAAGTWLVKARANFAGCTAGDGVGLQIYNSTASTQVAGVGDVVTSGGTAFLQVEDEVALTATATIQLCVNNVTAARGFAKNQDPINALQGCTRLIAERIA